jgi:hypothetical protein
LLEVKIYRIVILDFGLIRKPNPHFFFIKRAILEILINGDSGFELVPLITQFILTHNKLIILPRISFIDNQKYFTQLNRYKQA